MFVAGIQMDVQLGSVDENLSAIERRYQEARQQGAEIVVFPECATTGYCFDSLAEAARCAESIPGPATERIASVCGQHGGTAVFGMLESAPQGGVYNAVAVVGPDGLVGRYRKAHLPYLAVDRFSSYGDSPFAVHRVGEAVIGVNICYDAGFPESARVLALLGADLIALPTNWPPGAECFAEFAINTRALENAVYYMAINRVGVERNVEFIGSSRICDPSGRTIAQGDVGNEQILLAEVDVERARRKRIVRVPDAHIIDRMADRRPEMYGPLTEPHSLPRPRDLA